MKPEGLLKIIKVEDRKPGNKHAVFARVVVEDEKGNRFSLMPLSFTSTCNHTREEPMPRQRYRIDFLNPKTKEVEYTTTVYAIDEVHARTFGLIRTGSPRHKGCIVVVTPCPKKSKGEHGN